MTPERKEAEGLANTEYSRVLRSQISPAIPHTIANMNCKSIFTYHCYVYNADENAPPSQASCAYSSIP